jgi:hypothetical protein
MLQIVPYTPPLLLFYAGLKFYICYSYYIYGGVFIKVIMYGLPIIEEKDFVILTLKLIPLIELGLTYATGIVKPFGGGSRLENIGSSDPY